MDRDKAVIVERYLERGGARYRKSISSRVENRMHRNYSRFYGKGALESESMGMLDAIGEGLKNIHNRKVNVQIGKGRKSVSASRLMLEKAQYDSARILKKEGELLALRERYTEGRQRPLQPHSSRNSRTDGRERDCTRRPGFRNKLCSSGDGWSHSSGYGMADP